mmetsp:Transcript_87382/g.242373  ORF Transcript_87382/g.242373 Transcript_87382/m.242373 type:complete len:444 (-) Transcript_87382:198-1529(-)
MEPRRIMSAELGRPPPGEAEAGLGLQEPLRGRAVSEGSPAAFRRRGSRHDQPLKLTSLPVVWERVATGRSSEGEERTEARATAAEDLPSRFQSFRVGSRARPARRLLDREASFQQSHGRMRVRRINDSGSTRPLRWEDAFHSLVNLSTGKVLSLAAGVLIGSWLIFACLFGAVSRQCGLQADTFLRSLYLAIETIETIGYGVQDPYFNGCRAGVFVLGAAALWESLLNALVFSLVYARVSRAQVRATSVCFSEKAVVCQIDSQCYFMFQVCDFRKHQLCEAHVRLYCVQHSETAGGVTFQTRAMRLQHPDDELGGMLLLALPQLVVHRIDPWSPLCPPQLRGCAGGSSASCYLSFPEIPQRACDAENGQREPGPGTSRPPAPSLEQVAKHLAAAEMEVLCLVEGVEPATSGTLQARCSYTNDDVVYDAPFSAASGAPRTAPAR